MQRVANWERMQDMLFLGILSIPLKRKVHWRNKIRELKNPKQRTKNGGNKMIKQNRKKKEGEFTVAIDVGVGAPVAVVSSAVVKLEVACETHEGILGQYI